MQRCSGQRAQAISWQVIQAPTWTPPDSEHDSLCHGSGTGLAQMCNSQEQQSHCGQLTANRQGALRPSGRYQLRARHIAGVRKAYGSPFLSRPHLRFIHQILPIPAATLHLENMSKEPANILAPIFTIRGEYDPGLKASRDGAGQEAAPQM